jgi:NAD(P)-dependent dehydrogenase (short-subunit alcohol dehydrogenase family)
MDDGHSPVALIVGGGTGIGYATAERLARRGHGLVLAGRRDEVLERAAERLRLAATQAQVVTVPGDAAVPSQAERMAAIAVERFGALDVYVNAAGSYEPVAFDALDESSWRSAMSTNLDTQFFAGVAVARRMIANGGGRMILISSVSDPLSERAAAHYSAAKAAVSSLARSIAVDLTEHGIIANAVAPAWIHTEMVDDFAQNATAESLKRVNLLGRMGKPDEVASVVEYLATDAPAYLTGTTLFVDGGQTAMALLP